MGSKDKINVVQDPEKEITRDVLADSIKGISDALASLTRTGLIRSDLIALIQRRLKNVGSTTISAVLGGIEELRKDYTK